ncbi:hypothetical protein EJ08DRAFT_13106 [Tothia fuscella]|uniref:Ribophorin II C-terminal domain-containing protein n=1 Tax=Tothia fuscella TaxID=1048955 RepID=A0A9P4P4I0_9PEZI|nr:hypothetical protein EJ08DRAFT_13106 [Tothia fuscella]
MRLIQSLQLLALGAGITSAASWSFEDGTVAVQGKGSEVGGSLKETITPNKLLAKEVSLSAGQSLKVLLTITNGGKARKSHQAFLTLADPVSGLEESFPFTLKDTGKAKVDLTHQIIPSQLLSSSKPLKASIVIGSFGTSTPYKSDAFSLSISSDPNAPIPKAETQLRYQKQPEIHHIFRSDPKSPPKIITLVFGGAVVACLPVLLGIWASLGANAKALPHALSEAPLSHGLYFGSILAMEGVFFLYYTSWNLFQILPVAAGVSLVIFLSGTRALSEVQQRRLDGQR